MNKKKLAFIKNDKKNKVQHWYLPSKSEQSDKVIFLLEQGKGYFRSNFMTETMDLSLKEFLEIIDVFTRIDLLNERNGRKRKK
jgi:hypothetical protein